MRCFGDVFEKNIDVDVFDNVLQNAKHRANDAFNDVNRPPLSILSCFQHLSHISYKTWKRLSDAIGTMSRLSVYLIVRYLSINAQY